MLQGIDRVQALLSRAYKSMSKGSYWKRTTTWQILYSLGRFKRGEGYFCKGNQQKRLLWRRSYWREICKKTEKEMLGIWMLKKLFNKCIEINRIIKAIVLLVCACVRWSAHASARSARPVRRAPGRSARSRPLAAARLAPPLREKVWCNMRQYGAITYFLGQSLIEI